MPTASDGSTPLGRMDRFFNAGRNDDLLQRHFGGEIIGQADVIADVEELVLNRPAQVGIDNQVWNNRLGRR